MKNTPRFINLSRLVLVGSAALLLAPSMGNAAALTWKGNTSTDFAGPNWTGGTGTPVTGDSLSFGVAGTQGTVLASGANLSISGLTFTSLAPAYTLSGSSITLTGGVTNSSAATQTINNNVVFDPAAERSIGGSGNTVFAGAVTSGSMKFNATGTTTFSNSFTAAGNLNIGAGELVFSGNASANNFYLNAYRVTLNGSGTINTAVNGTISAGIGGVFTIDNSTTNVNNRIGANAIYRGQGGAINYISNNNAAGSTDTFAKLNIGSDVANTTINLTANTSGSTVLKFNDVQRALGVTLWIQGQNLGATPGAGATNLVFTAQPSGGLNFSGGGGAAGSTFISIVPYAVGQDTVKTGNSQYGFLTAYAGGVLDTTNGLRFLAANEYANTIDNNGTLLTNVSLTTSVLGLTGSTNINSLRLDNGGSVEVSGTLKIHSGAILALEGNGGISGGTLRLDNGRDFVITTVGDLTLGSALMATSGNIGLTKTGEGTLTISSVSSYTGSNALNAGTLKLAGGNLGASTNTLTITGTTSKLDLNGTNLSVGSIATSSGATGTVITNDGTQTATLTIGDGVATTGSSSSFARITDGTGKVALVKKGNTRQYLSAANTYSGGTTVESGTLYAANASAFGAATGTLTVNGGAAELNGFSLNVGALNGTGGSVRNSSTLSTGSSNFTVGNGDASGNYAGTLTNDTKAINLIKTGNGTQVLSGANTYTGTTAVNAGTLQFGKAVSLYNGNTASWTAANIKVASGATLAVNVGGADGFSTLQVSSLLGIGGSATTGFVSGSVLGLDTTNGDFEYSGAIANAYTGSTIGLKKLGQNKLTLSGANTYSGATNVAAGILNVKGSLSTGTVTVANGATLGGIGSIGGAAIVNGTLAAGDDGIGTFKTGALTLGSTSIFDAELGDGGASDKVEVTGGVNIGAGAELKLTLSGLVAPATGDIFFLIDNTDSNVTVGDFSFTSDTGLVSLTEGTEFRWNNQDWKITYQANATASTFGGGNDVAIQLQAVPEPATWALLVGGLGMLFSMQGLRKRSKAS